MSSTYPDPLCKRPGLGKAGRPSQINVNYFPITLKNPGTVFHYDVVITPEVPIPINKEVFEAFMCQYSKDKTVLNGIFLAFDGVKNAFAPRRLPFSDVFEDEIVLPERGGSKSKNPRLFKLKLTKVNEIKVDPVEMQARTPAGLMAIMAYNIVFRYQPNKNFVQIKDSFYTRENVHNMSGGLEVWPGFFRSFMPCADGLALNVDTIVCTFYRPGNLLDLITAFIGLRNRDELRDPRFKDHVKRIQSFVRNLRITLSYRGESSREYKIRSISATGADATKFDLVEEGVNKGKTTIAKYFTQKFGTRLQFPMLPCVEIKKGVLIPMELCEVLPGQRYPKKLSESQTAEMIKITCVPPKVRADKIKAGLRLMECDKNECLKQFGIAVTPTLKVVNSRILPTPTVLYHPTSKEKALRPMDGAWNLRDKKLFEGKSLKVWAVVVFGKEVRLRRRTVETFLKEHIATCIDTGMPIINKQPDIYYSDVSAEAVHKSLQQVSSSIRKKSNASPQLLMCVLPDKGAQLYGAIKTTCELELGIPTQCIQYEKVSRPNKQYCANVCLKMNAKLGGINASMTPADLGDLKAPPTLLLGADVTHPSPGAIDAASVAAVIGSVDSSAARYSSQVRVQESRVEMIGELKEMVKQLLKSFFKNTRVKPAQIIYFRDGVSEGQFQEVLLSEMTAIKQACAEIEKGYAPKVTFVVVQKRHHTRFFPIKPPDMDRSGNCKAGTVVETGICHSHYFDFFLQSHSGLQGTSRPVHYHVLIDEIRFTTDRLQALCNNMCYLFSRATRAVSLVPPVYYAHLAAARARFHYKISDNSESASTSSTGSHRPVHAELVRVMYYV
ncbi:hypothetical protein DSO57_1010708 [Entomophthora muscae]|uniref:Uncharacterized protein n=1 Tax=Entomophthora muscae TaxID=34485 RepID=A0ACC2T6C7_9FUNG|nr:hypothetical protein DSO57_1010708 [Entomophthora muscae]